MNSIRWAHVEDLMLKAIRKQELTSVERAELDAAYKKFPVEYGKRHARVKGTEDRRPVAKKKR